ncbi:MAG: hypothetical protein NWT02_07985, partial [Opitutales bacterium]|nr:hypothetical protein [Opitutales bacterium]
HIPPLFFKNDDPEESFEAFQIWFNRYRPDAILSSTAIVKEILDRLQLQVPQDIAVAVTSVLDAHFDTGIDQKSYEIGRVAVSKLAGLINENETGLPQTIRRTAIEGIWVQGSSCPPKETTT